MIHFLLTFSITSPKNGDFNLDHEDDVNIVDRYTQTVFFREDLGN